MKHWLAPEIIRQRVELVDEIIAILTLSMAWWFAAASRYPTYVMVLPSLVMMGSGFGMIRLFGHMGVIKQTGKRWASTLFGTRTFRNHVGAAIGAIVIGLSCRLCHGTRCRMIRASLSRLP